MRVERDKMEKKEPLMGSLKNANQVGELVNMNVILTICERLHR